MDELPQYILTSPSPHFRWTGSCLQILLTSPSLHLRWAGSFLQFILTSSSLNSDGRAPTIHIDELLPSTQMDELPQYTLMSPSLHFRWTGSCLQILLTSPSLHVRWAGSFLQFILTSSSLNSDGRAPTIHIDELLPSTQMDELPQYTLTSPSLHFRWMGSFLQFTLTSSSP